MKSGFQNKSADELALIYHGLSGLNFNMVHRQSKSDDVNDDAINSNVNLLKKIGTLLQERTGLNDVNEVSDYIKKVVDRKEQERINFFENLSEVGTVFGYFEGFDLNPKSVFEVVSSYAPSCYQCAGPDFKFLVRRRKDDGFQIMDDRNINLKNIKILNWARKYKSDNSGIIRNSCKKAFRQGIERIIDVSEAKNLWNSIIKDGSIFYHNKFEDYFEPMDCFHNFTLRGMSKKLENSVFIAVPQEGKDLVEITFADLPYIEKVYWAEPSLAVKSRNTSSGSWFWQQPNLYGWNKLNGWQK